MLASTPCHSPATAVAAELIVHRTTDRWRDNPSERCEIDRWIEQACKMFFTLIERKENVKARHTAEK
jgi:hypothetical protein